MCKQKTVYSTVETATDTEFFLTYLSFLRLQTWLKRNLPSDIPCDNIFKLTNDPQKISKLQIAKAKQNTKMKT